MSILIIINWYSSLPLIMGSMTIMPPLKYYHISFFFFPLIFSWLIFHRPPMIILPSLPSPHNSSWCNIKSINQTFSGLTDALILNPTRSSLPNHVFLILSPYHFIFIYLTSYFLSPLFLILCFLPPTIIFSRPQFLPLLFLSFLPSLLSTFPALSSFLLTSLPDTYSFPSNLPPSLPTYFLNPPLPHFLSPSPPPSPTNLPSQSFLSYIHSK